MKKYQLVICLSDAKVNRDLDMRVYTSLYDLFGCIKRTWSWLKWAYENEATVKFVIS